MNRFFYRYFFCVVTAVCFLTGCQSGNEDSQILHIESARTVVSQGEEDESGASRNDVQGNPATQKEQANRDTASSEQRLIGVYVHGAVRHPGVYYLPEQSRVCDAVLSAGGFTKNAARAARNQAEYLVDGEDLWIMTRKEYQKQKEISRKELTEDSFAAAEGTEHKTSSYEDLVNINTATKEELMTLPGIGQSKAEAILTFREENGDFLNIEDIMQVPGVKEGVFALMKDHITV